jgi:3-methyladenine DNA glycosylase AlkD
MSDQKPIIKKPRPPGEKERREKKEYLATAQRISHKEFRAAMHAIAEKQLEALYAADAAAALAAADQAAREKAEELERKYAENPLLRPLKPSSQTLGAARVTMRHRADPEKAEFYRSYFQTGPGQYAEGDDFLGLTVPTVRAVAKQFASMRLDFAGALLRSRFHEERLLALLILVSRFLKFPEERDAIFDVYAKLARYVNHWDLVDTSAPVIVGAYVDEHPDARVLVNHWVKSSSIWERRIAIISTHHFVRQRQFSEPLRIVQILLHDPHDLIHKAVGWTLREIGKLDRSVLLQFLDVHHREMPRTTLRTAIEHFAPSERDHYLGRDSAGAREPRKKAASKTKKPVDNKRSP